MNKEVVFRKEEIIKINHEEVTKMQKLAEENMSGKFRYCFHENESANMQEMLFVISKNTYARPHKHENVAETHVLIEGQGYFVAFNDSGEIVNYFKVSQDDFFIYRASKGVWHMLIPLSEQMVIYETREGKFTENTNIFPDWAPDGSDMQENKTYVEKIVCILEQVKCLR